MGFYAEGCFPPSVTESCLAAAGTAARILGAAAGAKQLVNRPAVPVNGPRVVQLDSLADFRARAEAWDDLWRRSEATLPTLRAELTAQWIEQFAPGAKFRAVVVEHRGRPVAALPLVGGNVAGFVGTARLPVMVKPRKIV